ncbi:glycoprotein hormones alpha chain [Poeciliopsis prolifica]|uniref:glycoprotein hormones alpha chain n=1 Tax=Poeciliopsis prolifica TaxID=188132 RepID=UPI002412F0A9|nr:glycoprotein hormones alpha chain [Poeciliopsis prolifica]
MVSAVTTMGCIKSAAVTLLLLFFLLNVADSCSNFDSSSIGCGKCSLGLNRFFSSRDRPIYQCMGYCFSWAYPTPQKALQTMAVHKNITSQASCCVAKHSYETQVNDLTVKNHTACHCSTCYYHKLI